MCQTSINAASAENRTSNPGNVDIGSGTVIYLNHLSANSVDVVNVGFLSLHLNFPHVTTLWSEEVQPPGSLKTPGSVAKNTTGNQKMSQVVDAGVGKVR